MSPISLLLLSALTSCVACGSAPKTPVDGPYHVIRTEKVGGDGGFDYVYADAAGRRLYVARTGTASRVSVFNLDTLQPVGEIANTRAHGAAFNPKTGECFSSQGDGTLTIIKETSPTTFEVEQTVKTMVGAKTLTLDPKTGHIFLIAAEYGPATGTPNPNGRQRRGPMIPG